MNRRQAMLATLQGQPTDRIPYVPRLDLWYRANKLRGTLPAQYKNATLTEIVDDLGWGYHAVVPNFRDLRTPEDDVDRPLGIYNLWFLPYRVTFNNVKRNVTYQGDRTIVEYHTPVGSIRTVVLYDQAMRQGGVSITHIEQHAIQTPQDYKVLAHIFANAQVQENYQGYQTFAQQVADRGIAVGYLSLAASPMHLIMRELMPLDKFFFALHDHPDEMTTLAQHIQRFWDDMLSVAADSPADVFLLGANYDASVTYPPFFAEHITPTLKQFADTLHARGKYLLTHTDGENTGLLSHYLSANIDIADSICPNPMTKLTLAQVRQAFASRITIMGSVPSIALLPDSMTTKQFNTYMENLFTEIGSGDHLILGISDTTPRDADFNRLRTIAKMANQFGPVTAPSPHTA